MLYFLGITSYLSDIYTNFRGRRNNSIFVDMLIREFSASFSTYIYTIYTYMYTVPDLPLCLGVLEHRAPLARVAHLPAKKKITMDFCLYHAILNY